MLILRHVVVEYRREQDVRARSDDNLESSAHKCAEMCRQKVVAKGPLEELKQR